MKTINTDTQTITWRLVAMAAITIIGILGGIGYEHLMATQNRRFNDLDEKVKEIPQIKTDIALINQKLTIYEELNEIHLPFITPPVVD